MTVPIIESLMQEENCKIGAVGYINAIPLCHYLQLPALYDVPARLESLILSKEIDLALLPVFSYLKNPQLHLNADLGVIQCDGAVKSVMLFTKKELSQIKKIKYTSESRTSVALFKVLYNQLTKAHYQDLQEDSENFDAELVIGDHALLRYGQEPGFDLGLLWKELTGLPFIFAAWISRAPLPKSVSQALKNSRQKGLEDIDSIIDQNHDFPQSLLEDYLKNCIQYTTNTQSLLGLKRFGELCYQTGLLPQEIL